MKKAANDRNSLNATLFIDKDGVTLRRSAGRQLGDIAFCTNSLILMTNLIKQGHGKTVCGGRKIPTHQFTGGSRRCKADC
jgi:hypothetical protein